MAWLRPAGGNRLGSSLSSSMTRLIAARVSSSAKISNGPSPCVTASCWGGFSPARRPSTFAWRDSPESKGNRVYRWVEVRELDVTLTPQMAQEADIRIRDHLLYELARDLSSSLE